MSLNVITPYGGRLIDLRVPAEERADRRAVAHTLPSIQLTARQLNDLELLATGGFSPLDRFMGQRDYERVVEDLRLADGTLFPIPVTLAVDPTAPGLAIGAAITLSDEQNLPLAILHIEEIYAWDRAALQARVFGTTDSRHPLVAESARWGGVNVSGRLEVIDLPTHYDFTDLRLTPAQTRARLAAHGHERVVAFQTRNPLHRAHEELTKRAASAIDGALLLHPVVGLTKPGDVDHYTRVRAYRALVEHYYDADRVLLALLPLAMRMAGPREAVWHALIRRNHGATHFIVGRDHASPGVDSTGKPFYGPYAAHDLVAAHADELGITPVPFHELVYLQDEDRYEEVSRITPGARTASISGTQVREDYLSTGRPLPAWFTRPEVAAILAQTYPPRRQQGVCIWFTGLSGAGKSTTAEILAQLLLEQGRQATILDGDVVRMHLSKGLGFSKADRDANILRIGFVAGEVVRHGGIAICAAVSPYRAARDDNRARVEGYVDGGFIEVFVDTPIAVCETRDTKGMYAKARRGEITGFTGIDDPYEAPLNPEITLDTVGQTAEANAHRILDLLRARGFISAG